MLKNFLEKDLDRNFFKEFAEKINFSGIPLKAVVSEEQYRKLFQARHKNDAGFIKKRNSDLSEEERSSFKN